MLFLIISAVMLVFIAIFVFLGVLRGRKYAWQYSAVRLCIAVGSAIVAAVLAAILGNLVGRLVEGLLMGVLPSGVNDIMAELPSASDAFAAFVAMLVSPIIYYPIFLLVRGIISLFAPMIACAVGGKQRDTDEYGFKISSRKKLVTDKPQALGMALGGVCAFIMVVALASPLTMYANIANGALQIAFGGTDGDVAAIAETADSATNNVGAYVVRYGGGDVLNSVMTTTRVSDNTSNLVRETKLVTALGKAVSSARDDSCDRDTAANNVRAVGKAFKKTRILPTVVAELLDGASSEWAEGGSYMGIGAPLSNGTLGGIVKPIYKALRGTTYETVKDDGQTIANIVACFVRADAFGGGSSAVFSNEEVTADVFYELLENERLCVTVSGVVDFGVSTLCEKLKVRNDMNGTYDSLIAELDTVTVGAGEAGLSAAAEEYEAIFDKYAIEDGKKRAEEAASADRSGADMREWVATELSVSSDADMVRASLLVTIDELSVEYKDIVNKDEEAKKLARALSTVSQLADKLEDDGADTVTVVCELGPVLDAFSATETVGGELTGRLLTAILQSEKVGDGIGLERLEATDIANSIITGAHSGGYVSQMKTLGQTVEIIQLAADNGDTKAAVSAMLNDLTPDSAKTVQKVATPSVMKKNGVPDKSAKQTASMISDMLGNLSDAKTAGMSDEQLERETAAVNNVLSTAMSIDKGNDKTFGEGSATGVSASQFVNDIVDSDVVSGTVTDHVYKDGGAPVTDPLNSEREINDADAAELVSALDAKWKNASDAQRADKEFEKKLVATAALMNVSVTVTDSGVVKA